jgi:alkylation response protein AidB-like acyl-CoA dehydrogenase
VSDVVLEFGDSAELAEFRAEFRRWLLDNPPPAREPGEAEPMFVHRWHRQLYAGGWVGVDVPAEYGGRGLTPLHQVVISDELGAAGAPGVPRIGYLAHAILGFGSEEQRRTLLPRMLSAEDTWCQGFSEPGAGSDLAAMSTTALLDRGCYLVRGQKLWTSYAQFSSKCLLLARTDPEGPRHRSISAFVLDLDRPGVTVRPIRAANRDDEFCELFLDDVEIPAAQRLGDEGAGWALAMLTVAHERSALDTGHLSKYRRVLDALRTGARERPEALSDGQRRAIGRSTVEYEVLAAHARRRVAERRSGAPPGAEMSIDKLYMTHVEQRLYDLALELTGPQALLDLDDPVFHDYLYARAASVYGGTSQIQRNIVAKSLLGLEERR